MTRGNLNRHPDVEMDRGGRAALPVRTPVEITIEEHARRGSFMKRLIVATIGLSMGLAGLHGDVLAQIPGAPIITGNVDSNCITSPSANSPGANAGDWTITCGDIAPGPGLTVIGPPSVTSGPAAMPAPEPAAAPASEPAPVVAEPAPETTADSAPPRPQRPARLMLMPTTMTIRWSWKRDSASKRTPMGMGLPTGTRSTST